MRVNFTALHATIRLLFIRIIPLLLRPTAVMLEGIFITDVYLLVLVLPSSMMALTISSIPVHLNYYRSTPGHGLHEALKQQFSSALSCLILCSLLILCCVLVFLPLELGPHLIAAICLVFLIEKLADESSRALEFRKAFVHWFFVQSLRSGWFIIPIAAHMLFGLDYVQIFLISSTIVLILMALTFFWATRLRPCLTLDGPALIYQNLVFFIGSFLTAGLVQMPRLIVAKLFPEHAHIYLATAQICQGANVLFNVLYQIPYRKIIARRPQLFQRFLWPTMKRLVLPILLLALIYLAAPLVWQITSSENETSVMLILIPILLADTITLAILSAHFGYISWFAKKSSALITYIFCLLTACLFLSALILNGVWQKLSLTNIPALTVLIGTLWLLIIVYRHFPKNGKFKFARAI